MEKNCAPPNWPKEFSYIRRLRAKELHPALLEQFLSTGKEEDRSIVSPLIEQGIIHSHLKLEKITPHLKHLGKKPHPLSHTPYGGRVQYGVFAQKRIGAGVDLGEYVGEQHVTAGNWAHNHKDYDHAWTLICGPFLVVINAKKYANELAFVNDYRGLANEPNASPKWIIHRGQYHLVFTTLKPVCEKEEILIDYGAGYWQAAERRALIPS